MRRWPIVGLLVLASVSCGCAFIRNLLFPDIELKMPESLKEVRVLVGGEAFRSDVYIACRDVGQVSEIKFGQFDGKGPEELAIVGSGGAVFLDDNSNRKWTVIFEQGRKFWFVLPMQQTDEVNLVDVNGDGVTEFLNRGGHHMHPVILFDSAGRVRWKYETSGIEDSVAGDVDGDGRPEIAVSSHGDHGVQLLNADGQKLRRVSSSSASRLAMFDTDGDGKKEIIESNGQLRARDATGKILWEMGLHAYLKHFSPARVGSEVEPSYLVGLDDDAILIFDRVFRRAAELKAPGVDFLGDAFATSIRFHGQERLFATIIGYPLWDRSVLFLHDRDGHVAYHEILGEVCSAILALPADNGEKLLVGCQGRVLEYAPSGKTAPPKQARTNPQ